MEAELITVGLISQVLKPSTLFYEFVKNIHNEDDSDDNLEVSIMLFFANVCWFFIKAQMGNHIHVSLCSCGKLLALVTPSCRAQFLTPGGEFKNIQMLISWTAKSNSH